MITLRSRRDIIENHDVHGWNVTTICQNWQAHYVSQYSRFYVRQLTCNEWGI